MIGRIIKFSTVSEDDGSLTYFEENAEIPFTIKRCFYIYSVPKKMTRANHASTTTSFVLIVVNGKVEIELDNGYEKKMYVLNSKDIGLLVPQLVWIRAKNFSKDAVMFVLASTVYKDCKYITNYTEFIDIITNRR